MATGSQEKRLLSLSSMLLFVLHALFHSFLAGTSSPPALYKWLAVSPCDNNCMFQFPFLIFQHVSLGMIVVWLFDDSCKQSQHCAGMQEQFVVWTRSCKKRFLHFSHSDT